MSRVAVWAAVAALFAAGMPVFGGAVLLLPAVQVTMGDGSVTPIPLETRANPRYQGAVDFVGDAVFGDGSVRVWGTMKWDPFILWSVQFVDAGAPTFLTVSFANPAIGGPYSTATNEFKGQVEGARAALPAQNVSVEAQYGPDYPGLAVDPSLTLGTPSCAAPACGPFGPVVVAGSFNPGAMGVFLKMQGGGSLTKYTMSGLFELSNGGSVVVPEPGAWSLMAAGLGALAWLRRRRA